MAVIISDKMQCLACELIRPACATACPACGAPSPQQPVSQALRWWTLRSKFQRWALSCSDVDEHTAEYMLVMSDPDADDSVFYEPGGLFYCTDGEYGEGEEDEDDEWEDVY